MAQAKNGMFWGGEAETLVGGRGELREVVAQRLSRTCGFLLLGHLRTRRTSLSHDCLGHLESVSWQHQGGWAEGK